WPSGAASLAGCERATTRALRSPLRGWSSAAVPPTESAIATARRWKRFRGSRRSRWAWMAATAKPTAAKAASVMCSASLSAAELAMAARGSTSTTRPPSSRKPAGVFIQALAITTKIPDSVPLRATIAPASQCGRGEDDMEGERHRHLGARGEQVAHGPILAVMTLKSINPATDELLREYPEASDQEVRTILLEASCAAAGWKQSRFPDRAQKIRR